MSNLHVTKATIANSQIVLRMEFDKSAADQSFEISGHATQSGGGFASFYDVKVAEEAPDGTVVVYVTAPQLQGFKNGEDITVVLRVAMVSATVLGERQPESGQLVGRSNEVPSPHQAELAGEATTWNNIRATVALSTDPWDGRPAFASGAPSAMSAGDPAAHPASISDAKVTERQAATELDARAHGGKAAPSAGEGSPGLTELRSRVAALEAEHARLLAGYAEVMESEIARLRSADLSAVSGPAIELRREPLTPSYLGRALTAIESDLANMETSIATGDEAAARRSKVKAAQRSCLVLGRLCDDDDFNQVLMTMKANLVKQESNIEARISETSSGNQVSFRELEIQLLELAGLPEILANKHVDDAIKAYWDNSASSLERMRDPMIFMRDLRRLRDVSCQTVDLLSEGLRREQSRQRWKKLLTYGLGGTAIVVANSIGTALLGPVGVAASGALGSAAVGVAVSFVS